MLLLALLFLVGMLGAYSDAECQQTISVDPTVIHVPYTLVGSHYDTSYTMGAGGFGWGDDGIGSVEIKTPAGFTVSYNAAGPWYSDWKGTSWKADNISKVFYIRYSPTSPAGNAGTITNDLYHGQLITYLATANLLLVNDPLPIQPASFKAATLNSNGVSLTWKTVSETNNYGFEVQRGGIKIAFIAGHGTTIEQHTYSYTDNPSPGKYRYRLKQVDLDGTATLSESVAIDVTAPAKFALDQSYPNPFNPSTQMSFSVSKEGPVTLRIYDILGREVSTLVNEIRKPGKYTEPFSGSQMASGVYVYVLRSSEGQLTGRMVLSK